MKKFSFSNEDISALCSELEYLLHAGVGSAGALEVLAKDEERKKQKEVLTSMTSHADSGLGLSAAFRESGAFPDYVSEMLEVGEESGRTDSALDALAKTTANRAAAERKIASAMLYPSILFVIMLAVIGVLLIYVLPVFETVYSQLGGSLTGLAGDLLSVGNFLGEIAPLLGVILGIFVLFLFLFSSVRSFRDSLIEKWQSKMGDKGVAGKMNTARFARALSLAVSSGMYTETAIQSAVNVLSGESREKKGEECIRLLRETGNMSLALRETCLLPSYHCRILEAGIKGGAQEMALETIAQRLEEDSDNALDDAIGMVEPAMVLISSILVGVIIISVMLPLVNIMSALG